MAYGRGKEARRMVEGEGQLVMYSLGMGFDYTVVFPSVQITLHANLVQ